MKTHATLSLVVCSMTTLAVAAGPVKKDFESDPVGAPPPGFEFARTGGGAEGKWIVRIEKGADKNHVLVQESPDPTGCRGALGAGFGGHATPQQLMVYPPSSP